MKFKKAYFLIVAVVTILAFLAGLAYVQSLDEPDTRGLVFVSIGLNQAILKNEVSSYEIARAVEHFSDVVLGWTVEPMFENELEAITGYPVALSGRRQEKQNLLFTVSASPELFDEKAGEAFLLVLKGRISEYNQATNGGYVIGLSRYSDLESDRADGRIVLGFAILALVISSLVLFLWEYGTTYRRRS